MSAFLATHPESAKALQLIRSQPVSSGFENSTYNSLNAFRFINAHGAVMPVRWSMAPVQPFVPLRRGRVPEQPNELSVRCLDRELHASRLQWHLIITMGQPGDPTDDATLPWPPDRQQVDVGTLTIDQVESEDTSLARDINFDPLVLPNGIAGLGRSVVERAIGGLLAIVHPARRRAQGSQRRLSRRNRKVIMAETSRTIRLLSRILHWLMAAMLLAMLFIGVSMVASLGNYHRLVAIHRPLGIMILILAASGLMNRMLHHPAAVSADDVPAGTTDRLCLGAVALHA